MHLCLPEIFCYLADGNSSVVQQLMEITQQPPLTTEGDPLSHLMYALSAVPTTLLSMAASFGHCRMILRFAVIPQAEPKIASNKKSCYEVRKLPARGS